MDIYASGYTAPIVELHLQYRKPLKVNDTAVVETRYIATEAAKVCFEYTIRSATDAEVVAEANCNCSRRSSTANGKSDGR